MSGANGDGGGEGLELAYDCLNIRIVGMESNVQQFHIRDIIHTKFRTEHDNRIPHPELIPTLSRIDIPNLNSQ